MKKLNSIWDYILRNPAIFFLIAAILVLCILKYLDHYDPEFKVHDLLVEAHGLFYDLLVFGILLSLYESITNKKERIRKLKDEIDDFRGWNESEATYRNVGNIKRLIKEGEKNLILYNSYLDKANLYKLDLRGVMFSGNLMRNAILDEANLTGSNLMWANLSEANLFRTILNNSILVGSNLSKANLSEALIVNSNLREVDLSGARLRATNLTGSNFTGAILKGSNMTNAVLIGANFSDNDMVMEEKIQVTRFEPIRIAANLSGADLSKAQLMSTNFSTADLSYAKLIGANLTGADLSDTILDYALVEENWFDKIRQFKVVGENLITLDYKISNILGEFRLVRTIK